MNLQDRPDIYQAHQRACEEKARLQQRAIQIERDKRAAEIALQLKDSIVDGLKEEVRSQAEEIRRLAAVIERLEASEADALRQFRFAQQQLDEIAKRESAPAHEWAYDPASRLWRCGCGCGSVRWVHPLPPTTPSALERVQHGARRTRAAIAATGALIAAGIVLVAFPLDEIAGKIVYAILAAALVLLIPKLGRARFR